MFPSACKKATQHLQWRQNVDAGIIILAFFFKFFFISISSYTFEEAKTNIAVE